MKHSFTTKEITFAAFGIALTAICSWLSVPFTVPFTLQTFAVCLVSALFGFRLGLFTVACYILLGAFGAPVFSGFKGGFGVLLGTTGGYIIGFLFTAIITGFAADHLGRKLKTLIPAMALGVLVCYAFGTAWFMIVYTGNNGPVSLGTALSWCVLPYLIPDAVKITLAAMLAKRLFPILQKGSSS